MLAELPVKSGLRSYGGLRFGGFVGYGSGVPGGMMSEEEELMRRMMYDG